MAASFIKKSDGNYYLRLTGFTNYVKFAAVSKAGNVYTFFINGTAYVSKPKDDEGATHYTSSASPIPSGGVLADNRFPGTETLHFFSGSGTRDYLLSFTSSPVPGTRFYLGGEALTWGGYAWPGDGYIENNIGVGVKTGGSWKNAGNLFLKTLDEWKEVATGWIKVSGVWRKFYQNYGNSSWINMLEGTDDAIDFGIKVVPPTEFTITISSNTTNLNLKSSFDTTFGSGAWASSVPKRVIINSGVIVGSTSSSGYAINIPSGMGGTLRIDNNGSIQGAGGAANSGTGGSAIFVGSAVSINNVGSIYAGGGGGGAGGNGGQGSFTYTVVNGLGYSGIRGTSVSGCNQSSWLEGCAQACRQRFGNSIGGSTVYASTPCGYTSIGLDLCFPVCKYQCTGRFTSNTTASESWTCAYNSTATAITSGGTGGSGGVGRGYNQAPTAGLGGSGGGTNAGTGGTGGNGGEWGASGTAGSAGTNGNYTAGSAGGPGGLAGFYVVNNSSVTWINTGTRAGRVV
jgi:hypothetical protein